MKLNGFKNSNIYVYRKGIINTSLKVEGSKITAIDSSLNEENLFEVPSDLIVVPGFVDKHIHGANKSDFMNPSFEQLDNITNSIVKEGTTSCLATTMTQENGVILKALSNIGDYIEKGNEGAEILGVHLEGPFISPKFAGAQPKEYIIPCDVEKFKIMNEAAKGHIKQVSFACEENGLEFAKYLSDNNIVGSLGHTNSTYDEAVKAVDLGVKSTTHTYNAMRGVHHRDIGVVGLAFLDDRVSSELICDLIHVSKPAVKLLAKSKGLNNVCLITDSMEAKYMPDGEYELGGQKVIVKDESARLVDGTLAGSILKLNDGIRNFKNILGISLTEAIDCATINPAKCLNVADRKGSIEIGKDADFTVIDEDLNVYMTVCRGKIVYSKL